MTGVTDVIVVGLGAMGSSVTLRLAERGLRVTGIDRFSPPHDHGSTHGETRITRLAIGEGASYAPLVRRSHQLWREIERATGTALLHQTGGLILGAGDNAFLGRTRAVAREHGIAHEDLSTAELARRFPMFEPDADTEAYFEPEAGYVHPERAVAAQLSLARRAGAELRLGETVLAWEASASGVVVNSTTSTLEARELVLCAGAWIAQLFPQGASLFVAYRQHMHWFPIRHGYEALRAMPVFVWETGGGPREFAHASCFYGFPAIDGPGGGVKLATERYESIAQPELTAHAPDEEAAGELHAEYLERHFRWVDRAPLRSAQCLYTNTRDSNFVIDRHPDHANVTIVSACSGHGFKHSPAIGEAVAQWVTGGRSELDLAPFRLPHGLR